MESFFCQIYEFHLPTPTPAVFTPAVLPPRYAIRFVPTLLPALPVVLAPIIHSSPVIIYSSPVIVHSSPVIVHSSPVIVHSSPVIVPTLLVTPITDGFSVVSSVNFVPASIFTSSSCIGTTQ